MTAIGPYNAAFDAISGNERGDGAKTAEIEDGSSLSPEVTQCSTRPGQAGAVTFRQRQTGLSLRPPSIIGSNMAPTG
jgi:hypothetical protein